jgi:glycine/serine hydroxymethyltransferase
MQVVGDLIDEAVKNKDDAEILSSIKAKVKDLAVKFPVPGIE